MSRFTAATPDREARRDRDHERQRREPERKPPAERAGLQRDQLHVHGRPDDHERESRGERELAEAGRDERVGLRTDRQHDGECAERDHRQPEARADRVEEAARHRDVQRGRGDAADHQEAPGVHEVVPHGDPERLPTAEAGQLGPAAGKEPVGPADALPDPAHDQRGGQRGEEPGQHHLRSPGERDGGGDQDHRVDRRGGQQERQRRRGRHPAGHQPAGDRNRAALAAGQDRPGDAGHRDRGRRPAGQRPGEERRRDEDCDRGAEQDSEDQERQRLHADRHEDRRPGADRGAADQLRQQRPAEQDQDQHGGQHVGGGEAAMPPGRRRRHRPGRRGGRRWRRGLRRGHWSMLSGGFGGSKAVPRTAVDGPSGGAPAVDDGGSGFGSAAPNRRSRRA